MILKNQKISADTQRVDTNAPLLQAPARRDCKARCAHDTRRAVSTPLRRDPVSVSPNKSAAMRNQGRYTAQLPPTFWIALGRVEEIGWDSPASFSQDRADAYAGKRLNVVYILATVDSQSRSECLRNASIFMLSISWCLGVGSGARTPSCRNRRPRESTPRGPWQRKAVENHRQRDAEWTCNRPSRTHSGLSDASSSYACSGQAY